MVARHVARRPSLRRRVGDGTTPRRWVVDFLDRASMPDASRNAIRIVSARRASAAQRRIDEGLD